MATLILTAAGTAVAGPIGGAIGAVIGQAADQAIFAPKARHGPRLGDLSVQTSTYGAQLPKLFGRMRVAGSVVWATDLVERRASSGGGKGRPRDVSYSYSANFAVALSARPLKAVHRIWADGKLLRGAAGDFKVAARFRFYGGDEDQPVDPLIASAEGIGETPAFRGLAYVVFEDLELEDYGNRIPSLTFEVEGDSGEVAIGAIAEELSGGSIAAGETPAVHGYAASGDSVRSAVAALADAAPLSLIEDGGAVRLRTPSGPPLILSRDDMRGPVELLRRGAADTVGEVTISYYDPARDYQTGIQRAVRRGGPRRGERSSLAAALGASAAKRFAEARLAALWARRISSRAGACWRHLDLRPGAIARFEGERGLWKVDRWHLGRATLDLDLSRLPDGVETAPGADPGRRVTETDLVHGPSVLHLLDLPLPQQGAPDALRLFVAAAGAFPGWRRATVTIEAGGMPHAAEPFVTAAPAVMGHGRSVLASGPAALIDGRNSVEVELLHEGMMLEDRTDAALASGANLALLGSEIIQFASAEAIAGTRYRLSRLLRGRLGTEWAAGLHEADERFVLLEADSLAPVTLGVAAIGSAARASAFGVGDDTDGASAECLVTGEILRPPSPVDLSARAEPNGDILITWVRRSRLGWHWASVGDTPIGEEGERYLVGIAVDGVSRLFDCFEPRFVYTAAQQSADQVEPPFVVSIMQAGTHSNSRPTTLLFG